MDVEELRSFGPDDPLGSTGITLRTIIPKDRSLVCDIEGCHKPMFARYPHGILCKKHEDELMEMRRKEIV